MSREDVLRMSLDSGRGGQQPSTGIRHDGCMRLSAGKEELRMARGKKEGTWHFWEKEGKKGDAALKSAAAAYVATDWRKSWAPVV